MAHIVVIGGGYAGLAALASLRGRLPDAELTLLDPGSHHLIRTRLHERIRHLHTRTRIPFRDIEHRFRCRHLALAPDLGFRSLCDTYTHGRMVIGNHRLGFDYLVITTGSRAPEIATFVDALVPDDLATLDWEEYVLQKLNGQQVPIFWITVVGGGPTSLQILFELETWRRGWQREKGRAVGLRLVTADPIVLPAFPRQMWEYVMQKIFKAGIEFHPQTQVLECRKGEITLCHGMTRGVLNLPSTITFACLGLQPHPKKFETNAFGQVKEDGQVLEKTFAAGDCAHFEGDGANTLSAQVATHKARLVAQNIHRRMLDLSLRPYRYREQGYFLSLGAADGAGWLGNRGNVVTGIPAFFIREAVETLYDLSLF